MISKIYCLLLIATIFGAGCLVDARDADADADADDDFEVEQSVNALEITHSDSINLAGPAAVDQPVAP